MKQDEKILRDLAMLRYQAEHYQALGRGSMSQQITAEIRRLTNALNANAVKN